MTLIPALLAEDRNILHGNHDEATRQAANFDSIALHVSRLVAGGIHSKEASQINRLDFNIIAFHVQPLAFF